MNGMRTLLRSAGSLWFAASLLVLILLAMSCATVVESTSGAERARADFYSAWWFQTLLALLAVNVAAAVATRYPFSRRHVGFVLTHGGILITLAGALATQLWGSDGRLGLSEGQTAEAFVLPGQERLLVKNARTGTEDVLMLGGGFGGPDPVNGPSDAVSVAGGIRFSVDRYLPDGRWVERVTDDGSAPRPAVELLLSTKEGQVSSVLFADRPVDLGNWQAAFRQAADSRELSQLLSAKAEVKPTSRGSVRVEHGDQSTTFPMEEGLQNPVSLAGADCTLRVIRYLPHAIVGADNQIVNASENPVNPAIEVEITSAAGAERRVAFARFPEMQSIHGQAPPTDLRVTFIASQTETPRVPIEVVGAPDQRVFARFRPSDGEPSVIPLEIGKPVTTPWPGASLTLVRRLERARVEWSMEAVTEPRQARTAAVLVEIQTAQDRHAMWVQKYQRRPVTVDGTPYELSYSDRTLPLGFTLTLKRFHIGHYPGTSRPRSFESLVTITDPRTGRQLDQVISMNHPAKYGGYTLFQSSYNLADGQRTSYLSVSRDPGLPIVFAGYVVMVAGMGVVIGTRAVERRRRREGQRSLQRPPVESSRPGDDSKRKASLPAIVLAVGCSAALAGSPVAQASELPGRLELVTIRTLPVQHDGRWMPLDTLARDVVSSVTGGSDFDGHDPVAVLLGWTFEPGRWERQPLITIANAELRDELELPASQTAFSYAELIGHDRLRSLIQDLSRIERGRKLDPLESKVSDLQEILLTLQMVFGNRTIRAIPHATETMGAWQTFPSPTATETPEEDPVVNAWAALGDAFRRNDGPAFAGASQRLVEALGAHPAAYRPEDQLLATELRYNQVRPFSLAWKLMLVGAALSAVAMAVQRRWVDLVAALGVLAGFGVLSYGLWLRWQIAGRIPAANMYESLLFLSWGAGTFAVAAVLMVRNRAVPLTATGLAAIALMIAELAMPEAKHFIRPIPPVLADTYWMSIHVPVIMVSYAVLALAVLIAHVQLGVLAFAPTRRRLVDAIDELHYWYVLIGSLLLLAGILTGSMWAASSWGRYWGWDPKEVWSLVAFLGYMAILHVRVDHDRVPMWAYVVAGALGLGVIGLLVLNMGPVTPARGLGLAAAVAATVYFVLGRGTMATAIKSVLAFWLIVMTYVGVNYVLGIGLHSYGFGTGAVARKMLIAGVVDLAMLGALCGTAMLRKRHRIAAPASL